MDLKQLAIAKPYLLVGAFFALTGVILGAFGSHGLKGKIEERFLDAFDVGVRYQLIHSLALLLIAITLLFFPSSFFSYAALSIALGTFIFSSSLYVLALSKIGIFGAITPIGGFLLIAGWVLYLAGIFFDVPKGEL